MIRFTQYSNNLYSLKVCPKRPMLIFHQKFGIKQNKRNNFFGTEEVLYNLRKSDLKTNKRWVLSLLLPVNINKNKTSQNLELKLKAILQVLMLKKINKYKLLSE